METFRWIIADIAALISLSLFIFAIFVLCAVCSSIFS